MKHIIIVLLFLLPITVSAQLLRSYGVVEIGSTFPTSSSTGAKFAYRTVDSSYYRWVSGNTWVKIIEPSIIPDTLYLTEEIGTSYKVSGDTINLTPYLLKSDTTAMLVKYIERGDTAAMLTPYVTFGNLAGYPTGSGTADRSARWSATNTLAVGNFTDNGTKVQALLPFQLQQWTTAGRPTGVTGYEGYNTTGNGKEWYQGSRWAYALESTFARGTATYVPFFDANGQVTESQRVVYNGTQFVVKGTTNYASTNTKSFRVLSNDGVEMFFVDDNGTFGNAALSVSLGAGAYQFGTSGFPAFRFPGAYNILQHQTTTSFNIGGGATNIRIGDYNSWQSTRTLRVNTKFEINGSTTANHPSATAAMSVLYHNTDSTFLEYNPNNTGWVGIASRPYVRSLIPTTFYSGDGSLSGNRTIMANNYNVLFDNITEFNLLSGGVTPASTILADSYFSQTQYYNLGKTKYFKKYESVDTRTATASGFPNFISIYEDNFGGGVRYEWEREVALDTTNNVYNIKQGARSNPSVMSFLSIRPSTGTAYQNRARYIYSGINAAENETANTYHSVWSKSTAISDQLMSLKDGGKFLIASDSTFIFDPAIDVPQFNKMGVGNKEAADLSKTQSNYIAGFATDGTVLDYSISNLPNGIYTGSGTLASTITRPLISPNNKLLFTQKYNSNADSAFIHFYNVDQITGNRSVAIGLTDTVHANGIAFIRAEKDEVNDKMQVTISSVDQDGTSIIELAGNSTSLTATDFVVTSAAEIRLNDGEVSMNQYGVGDMEAGDLSQTQSNYIAGFSITGRVLDLERKRDTTIYIDDSDYDFSAAVTTAQIARRYNRVIFWMTTTAAAGSDSEITLHTPDANLMQVEYLIHSVDEAGGFSNKIVFGTNNAVDSTNGLVTNYFPAAGQGLHVRAGLRSAVYKYRYY